MMNAPWLPWVASAGLQLLSGPHRQTCECVCEHRTQPADARLIELLQRQLDRCGPANLTSPAPPREAAFVGPPPGAFAVATVLFFLGLGLGVCGALWAGRALRAAPEAGGASPILPSTSRRSLGDRAAPSGTRSVLPLTKVPTSLLG